jgi:lipoprotein-anchoring transpeptidase ErfK/SrfK
VPVAGAPTIVKVKAGPGSGQLTVTYLAPAAAGTSPVTGYEISVDNAVTWWPCSPTPGVCILTNLTNDRVYSVAMRAQTAAGPSPASAPATGTPIIPPGTDPDKPIKLPSPRAWVNASFNAESNGLGVNGATAKLGVGTLPQLTFDRNIPNKKVVETHLTVKATLKDGRVRNVKGAWGWINDHTVVYRPMKWWPGSATVNITSTLDRAVLGKSGKTSLVGSDSLKKTYSFKTARKLLIVVDGGSDRMKVFIEGKKVKDFGVSLGKQDWETSQGVKVISTRKEPLHTYTSVSLNIDPTKEQPYELKDIPWNTRLTPTGEFIHSAPWAYGRIGRYNGSHGCTNMFESDAKWIYDNTVPGDVVTYQNTGGQTVQSWNGPGGLWNIPWADWVKKSASGSLTGNPNVSNPATAKPSDPTQSASA